MWICSPQLPDFLRGATSAVYTESVCVACLYVFLYVCVGAWSVYREIKQCYWTLAKHAGQSSRAPDPLRPSPRPRTGLSPGGNRSAALRSEWRTGGGSGAEHTDSCGWAVAEREAGKAREEGGENAEERR